MRVRPGVLARSRDLPRDFHARLAATDLELVVGHLVGDVDRSEASDAGQLIAKIAIQRAKPFGHRDDSLAASIEDRDAVVDVFHVGRFHEGVVEIFVRRIQRVIDLERTAVFGQVAVDPNITIESPGVAPADGLPTVDADSPGSGVNTGHARAGGAVRDSMYGVGTRPVG